MNYDERRYQIIAGPADEVSTSGNAISQIETVDQLRTAVTNWSDPSQKFERIAAIDKETGVVEIVRGTIEQLRNTFDVQVPGWSEGKIL